MHTNYVHILSPTRAYLTISEENNVIVSTVRSRDHNYDADTWLLKPILWPMQWVGAFRIFNKKHPNCAVRTAGARAGATMRIVPYSSETDAHNHEYVWRMQGIFENRIVVRPVVAWSLNWKVPGDDCRRADWARVILWENVGDLHNEVWTLESAVSSSIGHMADATRNASPFPLITSTEKY